MNQQTGTIFNLQKFSTEDGPGIRTTVFMKGCPLRCRWCANPESQAFEIQTAHRASKCRGCGSCAAACPRGAVRLHAGPPPSVAIDRGLCVNCGACVGACTAGSLRFYGETRTVDDVFYEIEKDIGYFLKSGGGVTVSGGEPMCQPAFVAALFDRCRSLGIHTALDTCGMFPTEALDSVGGLTDLVLFDLKLMDPEAHRRYTGADNARILQNFRRVQALGLRMFARIPLIPDVNDTDGNLSATADFLQSVDGGIHVDLLPYHNYGENKYQMLDMDYALSGIKRQSREKLEHCRGIFTARGIDCTLH